MIRAVFILIAGTLLVSALLTPAVFTLLKSLFPAMGYPFFRVFDRVAMLVAAVFIVVYRREFRLAELVPYLRGLPWPRRLRHFFGGAALALTTLAVLPFMVGGPQDPLAWGDHDAGYYSLKLAKVFPAAILISLIEESFFRVLLFGSLKTHMRTGWAMAASSVIYSAVHFITPVKTFQYEGFQPLAGFTYLQAVGERMLSPGVPQAFVGLLLVGLVLCLTIERTRSLYLCIGLHAGWVIALKTSLFSTDVVEGATFAAGVGRRYFLVAEPLTWLWVVVIGAVLWLLTRRREPAEPA